MPNTNNNTSYDVDGYDVITTALVALVNSYPALESGDKIEFGTLDADYGKALFATGGAIIERSVKDILGHTSQICLYPFTVVYRCGGLRESQKVRVKEWLDNLGRWLELQTVTINGNSYTLSGYPALTGTRKIIEIKRQTPAYLYSLNENNTEDWAVSVQTRYRNEF